MKDLTNIALKYHEAGIVVIPWRYDEAGAVKFPAWTKYQKGQTITEIKYEFALPAEGIALICTDGIEVIDIDVKADPKRSIHTEYLDELFWLPGGEDVLNKAVQVNTKSGGVHLIYRASNIKGNQKLATRKNCPEAMIETRGVGGLLFVYPSPNYEVVNGSMLKIPTITPEQRNLLIDLARSMNEEPEMAEAPRPEIKSNQPAQEGDLAPWDDYNQKNSVLDLLESDGWRNTGRAPSGKVYLSKPGASNGKDTHGAIIQAKDGNMIFWPFTTATQFDSEKGYNPFSIYTALNHGGDRSAAAKQLYRDGYGTRLETKQESEPQKVEQPKTDISKLVAFVKATKFDFNAPIVEEDAILTLDLDGKTYKIGGKGQVGAIVGEQKSGKSLVVSSITASALSGKPVLNFSMNMRGNIEYHDTEQSAFFYKLTQKRLYNQAGLRNNHPAYSAYHTRSLSTKDRVLAIGAMLKGRKDLGYVVIDGLVDLCDNFNDEKASMQTVDNLLRWSDETGALIITILHTTKAMGYVRGHLGTALQNKVDFMIEAKQDKTAGVYTVGCRESRFAPFPSFDFTRDENGMPLLGNEDRSQDGSLFEPESEPTYSAMIPAAARANKVDDSEEIPF